jgi:pimeloyl-ACP methyl ester carboxylesterase
MDDEEQELPLVLRAIEVDPPADGVEVVRLHTDDGIIDCRFHPIEQGDAAIIWMGGAHGGLDGPAGGMYPRLARHLAAQSVASLRLEYRNPGDLDACVLDVLIGVAFLEERDFDRVVLVGHSFGGAVAISAGVLSEAVVGVAALSSQTYGTDDVDQLSPTPLLLMHGTSDEILPDRCSRSIFERAREPKALKLYAACNHGLDACRESVDRDLNAWLLRVLVDADPD